MNPVAKLCGLVGGLVFGIELLAGVHLAAANPIPDQTLPQPSRVVQTGRRATITDGTRRGRNLFHSFREFSVAPGESASFQGIDPDITNIFARVTDRHASQIHGLIETLNANGQISTANLFLLNPNGIVFGKAAELRIGGSFTATTANRINFADGTQFSAVRPQAALLSISTPVGLQFGRHPEPIINRSIARLQDESGNLILDTAGIPFLGLLGSPNQTLALVGGDVTITGRVRTEGGRIEIGSLAGAGEVALRPTAAGWNFSYEPAGEFGDLRLLNGSLISNGNPGGEIQLQANRLILRGIAEIGSTSYRDSTKPGGALTVRAADSIRLQQTGSLNTSTRGTARAGDIILSTSRLAIQSGAQLGSFTSAEGRGGDVTIQAAKSVTVEGLDEATDLDSPLSLIFSQSNPETTGRAGNIRIDTDQLMVQNGGQISTNTFGTGNAGNLSIRASQIDLSETAVAADGQLLRNNDGIPLSGGLFVGTGVGSSGRGGRLQIETESLRLRDGAIVQATTYGSGAAGDISVQARQSIEVTGRSSVGNLPARIAATSGGVPGLITAESRQATGRGGSLMLSSPNLTVSNQGIITVNSASARSPGAGTIRITADQVQLDRQGQISAQTESGNRARIQIEGAERLTLRRNSNISTRAGIRSDGGDAGNIAVNAGVILAAPAENSNIDADARAGRGGNIAIQSQGILGIAERSQQTPQSDITATSESNVSGEINISTVSFDPTQGIVTLPDTVVDASGLIAQGCRAEGQAEGQAERQAARQSEFVITGRGGLPPNPTDLGSSSAVLPRWVTVPDSPQPSAPNATLPDPALATPAIVEAQGWVTTATGKVSLVAQSPASSPNAPAWELPHCLAPQSPDP